VRTQNGISDVFITRKGLRQGDVLCMSFNIALEKTVKLAGLDIRGTIPQTSVQILA
jgi:hypothetical protein